MGRPVAGPWFRASFLAAVLVAGCAAGPTSTPPAPPRADAKPRWHPDGRPLSAGVKGRGIRGFRPLPREESDAP
jgi:hypothetical protein